MTTHNSINTFACNRIAFWDRLPDRWRVTVTFRGVVDDFGNLVLIEIKEPT